MKQNLLKTLLIAGIISIVYLCEIIFLFNKGSLDTYNGLSSWIYVIILSLTDYGPFILVSLLTSIVMNRLNGKFTNHAITRILIIYLLLKSISILLLWGNNWYAISDFDQVHENMFIGIVDVYLGLISILSGIFFNGNSDRK